MKFIKENPLYISMNLKPEKYNKTTITQSQKGEKESSVFGPSKNNKLVNSIIYLTLILVAILPPIVVAIAIYLTIFRA